MVVPLRPQCRAISRSDHWLHSPSARRRRAAERFGVPKLKSPDDAYALVGASVELASRQLRHGIPADPLELEPVIERLPDYEDLVVRNEIYRERTTGVGVLPKEVAYSYGVSGPIARGSDIAFDVPTGGVQVVFSYDATTHRLEISTRFCSSIPTVMGDVWIPPSLRRVARTARWFWEMKRAATVGTMGPPRPGNPSSRG